MRKSHRVYFPGRRGKLAGILETPQGHIHGWILFSHCFTCNKDLKAIVRISRGLADCNWGVLRYDFSGLGGSEGVFSETNFSTNCEDLVSAANFLSSEYHAPRFLIGHSFGGAASLAMADQIPSVSGVIALAAPSDTQHLADLLLKMDPAIGEKGIGTVNIGGQKHEIQRQMVDDFRKHDLPKVVASIQKPVLVFHSPDDETVGFHHAILNAGYHRSPKSSDTETSDTETSDTETSDTETSDTRRSFPSTLVALPGSNHLLTNSERDIPMIVAIANAWCTRLI